MTRLTTPMTPSMAREYSPSTTASVSLNAPQHPWTCLCTACRNAFDLNEGLARKRPTATVHGWPQRLREIRATVSATMQSDNDGALLSVLDSLLEPQHPRRAQPEVDATPEPEVEALMRAGHLHPLGEDQPAPARGQPQPHSSQPKPAGGHKSGHARLVAARGWQGAVAAREQPAGGVDAGAVAAIATRPAERQVGARRGSTTAGGWHVVAAVDACARAQRQVDGRVQAAVGAQRSVEPRGSGVDPAARHQARGRLLE